MELLDARRLTGPSSVADGCGTVADVACDAGAVRAFAACWKQRVQHMHAALDWPKPVCVARRREGGVSLAFSAPVDRLYAATQLNEWAFAAAAAEFGADVEVADFEATRTALRDAAATEANPALLRLIDDAARHDVAVLWDDDEVSLGLGRGSTTWPVREIPATIDWAAHSDVPVGLVTGTNGKTTTVRLAKHILQQAGNKVGLSSTDWIAVNDRVLDRGDWSGPGGARAVLRETDVDVAILESARGGLLRRGLGVARADAALITNIAADHLGDFGSRNLDELLEIKWVTSRAVRERGTLILNADDSRLRQRAEGYRGAVCWFGLDPAAASIVTAIARGETAFALQAEVLCVFEDGDAVPICRADEIPLTLGGAARHNIANALAAAALTWHLGAGIDDIGRGLTSMALDDNPGRCNLFTLDGVDVLVDFAHNPAAMQALFDMAGALRANRRALCFGQAGDRPDALIREMTRDASRIGLDCVMISELAAYHRGRAAGEVFAVIRDELLRVGLLPDAIQHHDEELESLAAALAWAEPGDLVIMLALGGAAPVHDYLMARGAERKQRFSR